METSDPRPWWKGPLAVGGVLVAGALAAAWVAYDLWPEERPPATSPEKLVETFKAADKVDRENWEKMWRDAGKTPPPPPR